MNKTDENKKSYLLKFLDITALIAIISALLYASGWFYAYYYFDKFNTGLLSLEIPTEYYFLYSYYVIKKNFDLLFLLYAVVLICFLLIKKLKLSDKYESLKKRLHISALALILFLPLLIFSFFWGIKHLSSRAANKVLSEQQRLDFPSYPRVRVWLKEPSSKKPDTNRAYLQQNLPKGCYRLLLQNKSNLFLIYTNKKAGKTDTNKGALRSEAAVVVVPLSDVEVFRILPQYVSCGS